MNPKSKQADKEVEKEKAKEKKRKKENKEKKEENKDIPEKKSKLKELLESKDEEKKETKKGKNKTKKAKEKEKEPKQKKVYTLEFIMQLKEQKIANEELLLSKEVKEHFKNLKQDNVEIKKMKSVEIEKPTNKVKSLHKSKTTKREDNKFEEELKKSFNEALKDKNTDEKIDYYLEKINSDNYDFVKKELLDLIIDNTENQDKFIDSVIKISILKSPFCEIYAKLCKSLEKEIPKKSKEEDKADNKKATSQMKINLIDKARLLFTSEKFEESDKSEHQYIKDYRFKKNMLGITHFLIELIKAHILTKKVFSSCIQSLFSRYEKNKNNEILKGVYIDSIIIFVKQFDKLIHSKESKITEKEVEEYAEKIEEAIKKLEQIKDEVKEKYLKHKIINLIEKRKNNYEKTKFEIYLEEKFKQEPSPTEGDKFSQEILNDRIEKGLNDYICFIEKEGASDNYPWEDETFLIEKKLQGLDDILEAYFIGCGNTFESDIKHTKNYIKELIEYYIEQKNENEKKDLKNRLIKIFDIVRNDIPIINDVYANTINMFLENKILDIIDLEAISGENKLTKEELEVIDKVFKHLNEYSKEKKIKEEFAKLTFIKDNKDLFKWIFED